MSGLIKKRRACDVMRVDCWIAVACFLPEKQLRRLSQSSRLLRWAASSCEVWTPRGLGWDLLTGNELARTQKRVAQFLLGLYNLPNSPFPRLGLVRASDSMSAACAAWINSSSSSSGSGAGSDAAFDSNQSFSTNQSLQPSFFFEHVVQALTNPVARDLDLLASAMKLRVSAHKTSSANSSVDAAAPASSPAPCAVARIDDFCNPTVLREEQKRAGTGGIAHVFLEALFASQRNPAAAVAANDAVAVGAQQQQEQHQQQQSLRYPFLSSAVIDFTTVDTERSYLAFYMTSTLQSQERDAHARAGSVSHATAHFTKVLARGVRESCVEFLASAAVFMLCKTAVKKLLVSSSSSSSEDAAASKRSSSNVVSAGPAFLRKMAWSFNHLGIRFDVLSFVGLDDMTRNVLFVPLLLRGYASTRSWLSERMEFLEGLETREGQQQHQQKLHNANTSAEMYLDRRLYLINVGAKTVSLTLNTLAANLQARLVATLALPIVAPVLPLSRMQLVIVLWHTGMMWRQLSVQDKHRSNSLRTSNNNNNNNKNQKKSTQDTSALLLHFVSSMWLQLYIDRMVWRDGARPGIKSALLLAFCSGITSSVAWAMTSSTK